QAATVLLTVREQALAARSANGESGMSDQDRTDFMQPILDKYAEESSAWYSTARLWDDGIIEPSQTRNVLALSLAAALDAPIGETKFGIFRM
ncbi:MAG: methylcrotonoyl-CoA carboxylase, partial [Thermoleophilia bacterium]|nr:methylcrotonoyl-CoA carboxylase [Thermoleophilia bacterium]